MVKGFYALAAISYNVWDSRRLTDLRERSDRPRLRLVGAGVSPGSASLYILLATKCLLRQHPLLASPPWESGVIGCQRLLRITYITIFLKLSSS